MNRTDRAYQIMRLISDSSGSHDADDELSAICNVLAIGAMQAVGIPFSQSALQRIVDLAWEGLQKGLDECAELAKDRN